MKFSYIFSIFLASSCTQLTHRTYLSEMEHDDSTFFSPSQDFPVVGGDSGKYGPSEKDRRARTPASSFDLAEERSRRSLKDELKSLENVQREEDLEFYKLYKSKLATTSEKIYFLKLPLNERYDYLESRGFIEKTDQEQSPEVRALALRQSSIILGMSKDEVMEIWGKPRKIDIAGNPNYENERWLYERNGAAKYIYFESGRVGGWE